MKAYTFSLAAILVGCLAVISTPAHALLETPAWDRGLVFNLFHWDPFYDTGGSDSASSAMVSQGYITTIVRQDSFPSDSGQVTLAVLSALQEPYGALSIYTHGIDAGDSAYAPGVPLLEYCSTQTAARAARALAADGGLADTSEIGLTGGTHIRYDPNNNPIDTLTLFSPCLDTLGLQRISQPRNAIIHALICSGGLRYSDWTTSGTGSMASYNTTCFAAPASNDARVFWARLHGLSGRTNRTMVAATNNLGLSIRDQNATADSLVLAPWVIEVFPWKLNPLYNIDGDQVSYIDFDTRMNASESSADAAIRLSGFLRFYNSSGGDDTPGWEQDSVYSHLEWHVFPTGVGTGTVTILGSQLRSAGGILMNSGLIDPPLYTLTAGDTLNYTYRTLDGNPAVAFQRMAGEAEAGGNRIRFAISWEQYADSFSVERVAGPTGPALPRIPASGTGGPGFYELFDPYGSSTSRYRIIEHQAGARPDLEYDVFDARPASTPDPGEAVDPEPDSLASMLQATTGADSAEFAESLQFESAPLYLLVAPDSIVTSLMYYRSLWQNRGVTTSVVSMGTVNAAGGLPTYIDSLYGLGTQYVLLVGDANDAEWWDDQSRWINGWKYPRIGTNGAHLPSQPEHNLIPTTYTADSDSPHVAMSFYTPYYASDLPYADVDGNGTPDLRIGRLPADSRAEVLAYTFKLAAYLATTPASNPNTVLMTYARNNGHVIGRFVGEDADSVAVEFPVGANLSRLTDNASTMWDFDARRSKADSVVAASPDRLFWMASGAQRDIYGNYWRLDQRWTMDSLSVPSPAGRFFVSLGFSCGMGNFDQTEDYVSCDSVSNPTTCTDPIRPIPERLLLNATKGSIAVIGPTRGTFQLGNKLLAREMVRQLAVAGRDLGTAFMVAQANCLSKYPDYTDLFRSYVLLGDPMLGGPITTGVATSSPRVKPGLNAPRPNPFNPSTVLGVRLLVPGRAELRVYDVRGRLVRTLLNGDLLPAGMTSVRWDGRNNSGSNVASGVYIARLNAAGSSFRQKLVLLK